MKKMFTLVAAMIMAACAWADTQTYSPVAEYNTRPKTDGSGWAKMLVANDANQTFEITASANFYAVQQYVVSDLGNATSVTLSLKGGQSDGTDALAIWAVNGTFNKSMAVADFNALVAATTGVTPGAAGTVDKTYLMKDISNTKTTVDTYRECTFVINNAALTTLKSTAKNDTITLLITNKSADLANFATSKRKYYSSGNETEALRPTLAVVTEKPACQIGSLGYASLADAVAACPTVTADANEPTIITINKDMEISARINVQSQNITIKGATGAEKILRSSKYANGLMFLTKDTLATISIENIIIDGQNIASTSAVFEASNKGLTSLTNVTIQNVTTSAAQGIFCNKSNGRAYLNGVTMKDCNASAAKAAVFVGTNNLTLAGKNDFGAIYVEKQLYITNDNAEGVQEIIVDAAREDGLLVKNGVVANYTVSGTSLNLSQNGKNVYLGNLTAVNNINAQVGSTAKAVKAIKNGKIVIIKNNVSYNIAGAELK